MTSAANAVEKVSYNLLSDGNNIGAAVFQHVPQDTLPPVIIIGDIDVQTLALKDDPDRRISLTILTVTEAEERKSMLDLQDAIESRLDGARISHDGWIIAFTHRSWQRSLGRTSACSSETSAAPLSANRVARAI